MKKPVALIYRNQVGAASETFIKAQALELSAFRPVMLGWTSSDTTNEVEVRVLEEEGVLGLRRSQLMRSASPFIDIIQDLQPALIHAHFAIDAVFALPLAKRLRIPLLTTLHGFDVSMSSAAMARQAKPSWLTYLLKKRELMREGASFVAVSEHIRDLALQKGFPRDRVETHYIGVKTDRFVPATLSPSETEALTILHVGRLVEKKGTRYLILAFSRVLEDYPDALLSIIGEGPLRAELEKLVEDLGIRSHVAFRGSVDHATVLAHVQRCSIFCLPSVTATSGDTEGLPVSLLEAASCAIPVVSSDHAGAGEAIRDGVEGFLVGERDVSTLGARLRLLLGDEHLRWRMGAAGRDRVLAKFDLSSNTRMLERRYAELVGGR